MTANKSYLNHWQQNSYRNLWQHPIWHDFQDAIGRKVWMSTIEGASALVVKHSLPKGLCWLEVPRGPLFENEEGLNKILEEIKKLGQKEGSVFIRFSSYKNLRTTKYGLQNTDYDHHPQTSLVIDLTQSEEEILKQMKPKGRYNIKVAQKHGVVVKPSKNIDDFYRILNQTGNRDGFGIHSKKYYVKMLEVLGDNGQLLLAEHEGKVIAGGIFVYLDDWGIYYYGASDHQHRNLMAPYLIQWEAIQEAKKRGCNQYDFLGIAPENAKNHAWAGVTQFKKKFGGEVVNYPSAKELPLKPFWYWLYKTYKKLKNN